MNEGGNDEAFQQADNEMNIQIYHTNTNSNHTAAFHFMDPEAYNNQEEDGTQESHKSSQYDVSLEGENTQITEIKKMNGGTRQLTFDGRLDCVCGRGPGCNQC